MAQGMEANRAWDMLTKADGAFVGIMCDAAINKWDWVIDVAAGSGESLGVG